MVNLKKIQEDVMAYIATAKVLPKVLDIIENGINSSMLTKYLTKSPTSFLMDILKRLGISREELELWLTHFLIYIVPILEVSVKAILLTNLKHMVSCSSDPRIPEKYRKNHKVIQDYNTSQEKGIDINIESIDFMDKLSINPLGEFGSSWYFGLEGIEDSYKFARADDMDAFLWFVIHKGKFPNSTKINELSDIGGQVTPTSGSLLSTVEVTYPKGNSSSILLGNTYTYTRSHVISMCIDRKLDDENNIIKNTLVPVSDDWSSVNWYARRADQLGKNLGFGWGVDKKTKNTKYYGKGRDFSKERAICNIQYINQASSDAPITGLVNNKFRFSILPKPLIHIPRISEGEPPWRFKKMLFNDKGEYDSNGRYTLNTNEDPQSLTYLNSAVTIDVKSGSVKVSDKKKVINNLIECYPGLTVFEFNYDYVMSIKLFDAKVLVHSLMETILNVNLNDKINGSLTPKYIHEEGTETIKEIIKNIVESDESVVNDCYYTFDNTKYESLLRKAEEKRARQERFGDVTHEVGLFDDVNQILKEYDANAEIHEQEDVIHRAITKAAVTVSEGVEGVDKYDIEFNFVLNLIEGLTTSIVNSILSPKVLMLLEVNQKIMGGTWEKFTLKDLLLSLSTIIVAIVKEIRDLVIQELLKLIMKLLTPIIDFLKSVLLKEKVENYREAYLELMRFINKIAAFFEIFGNRFTDTKLDTVDYADIDTSITNNDEQPSTNKC